MCQKRHVCGFSVKDLRRKKKTKKNTHLREYGHWPIKRGAVFSAELRCYCSTRASHEELAVELVLRHEVKACIS